jgi:hypothetical protein
LIGTFRTEKEPGFCWGIAFGLTTRKETTMKLTTIALAAFFALGSALALAQGAGGGGGLERAALERAALERAEQEPARLAAVAAEVAEDHRRRKLKLSATQA